jgi:hypothetical protein
VNRTLIATVLGVAALATFVAFVACGSPPIPPGAECAVSSDCPSQGVCNEGKCEACDFGLPPPNDVCIPKCGNEKGVGQPCTKGGGECSGFDITKGEAIFCTIDFDDTSPLDFCTKPCSADADCGAGGVCPPDTGGGRGCVPAACNGEGEGEGEGGEGEGEGE